MEELSINTAAGILNLSEASLVRLLIDGALPSLRSEDVQRYKLQRDAQGERL